MNLDNASQYERVHRDGREALRKWEILRAESELLRGTLAKTRNSLMDVVRETRSLALRLRATAGMSKPIEDEELDPELIHSSLAGAQSLLNELNPIVVSAPEREPTVPGALAKLSARERQLTWALVKRGELGAISEEFGIAKNTVRNHLAAVRRKLGVNSQTELMSYMWRSYASPTSIHSDEVHDRLSNGVAHADGLEQRPSI
jgi:DNA-binding NarL/FixJ family response regulator